MTQPQVPASSDLASGQNASEVMSAFSAQSVMPLVARMTSHPVMISARDGSTVWVNDAFTRVSGWALPEIAGKRPDQFLHGPATDPDMARQVARLTAAGQPFQAEIENYRKDGSRFWIAIDAQPLIDPDGTVTGYFSVQSDITDRKRIEVQLRREHQLLKTITLAQSRFIAGDNPDEMYRFLLAELLGLTNSEYGFLGECRYDSSGKPYLRASAISDVAWNEGTRRLYEQTSKAGFEFFNLNTLFGHILKTASPVIANSPQSDERRGGIPEGHPPLNRFLGIPIIHAGKLIGAVGLANAPSDYGTETIEFLDPVLTAIGLLMDAHEKDVSRQTTEQTLRETEDWLEETGKVAEVGAWRLDIRNKQLRWSAHTKRIHEVPEDYEPSLAEAIHFYAPEARPQIENAVREGIATGKSWDLELPFVTAKGKARWVRALGRVERQGDEVVALYGAFQDVTDRHNAELEREKLHRQFLQAQKLESIGRLAGGIAHDFNNMLAVILGHSEMALMSNGLSEPISAHFRAIQTAGQRSADLTHQLLAFARRQHAIPQKVDLNRTAQRMLQLLRRSISEAITVDWRPGKDLWTVSIDPLQLDQVLTNLCLNARDALTDDGRIVISTHNETLSRTTQMRSSILPVGDYVVLTVSDNGTGISEKALQHLFEPFNTTKPVGQGTGLGLATVYGIVQQNGGAIDVESRPDVGTTFHVYFPRATHSRNPMEEIQEEPLRIIRKLCILLVEDEPALLKTGKLSLEQLGHRVLTARNAETAMQILQEFGKTIDIVISDLVMPGMNGIELARQICNHLPDIRFVFMSGYGSENVVRGMAEKQAVTILTKPFDLQQLSRAIHGAQKICGSNQLQQPVD
ncbi:MAG: response regulator [Planctomycetaceae bacterium]|nr:response regulator [Planctomycetaceae bacterium]